MQVLSIYGTNDGLTSLRDIEDSKILSPENTLFLPIDGGNHAHFGSYGLQSGDNPARISAEQQTTRQLRSQLLFFLIWVSKVSGLLRKITNYPHRISRYELVIFGSFFVISRSGKKLITSAMIEEKIADIG